jgi:hypothetical protein
VERVQGKKLPLTAAGVHGLREEYTRTIEPARALAAETVTLERTLSDLVNRKRVRPEIRPAVTHRWRAEWCGT